MCGIAGLFDFTQAPVDRALVERMADRIAHRGPDDAGYVFDGPVGLAHRRLSIIDLSNGGHQPMWNDDQSIVIVYNGECYNYRELRQRLEARGLRFRTSSDTEVLLRLYEQDGESFLQDVEGMFALAIWDRRRQQLLLARDRIGIKPLYVAHYGDRLSFASEMKSLLADPALPRDLDQTAFSNYLHLLSIPDPQSILRSVRKLEPGHMMVVTRDGVRDRAYWTLPVAIDEGMSFEQARDGFAERFAAAVSSHMVADVPVGAFLSGGVDSSTIVAFAAKNSPYPVETFSVTFPGLDEYDEGAHAREVAQHCGAHHHEFALSPDLIDALPRVVWHSDEPFAISSAFALYYISKLARDHVKVALSGDGSDELFAGYVWRHVDFPELPGMPLRGVARWINSLPALPSMLRRKLRHAESRDARYVDSFAAFQTSALSPLLRADLREGVAQNWLVNPVQRALTEAPTSEQLAQKLYADIRTTLVSEMLTKADRMTMAHGLEARVPFLDHKLVEWAFTVPGRHKLAAREGKLLIKKAMEAHLPHEILYRRKQGFNVPMPLWMRGGMKDYVRDILSPERTTRRGLLDPRAVTNLLDRHFSGQEQAANKIYALLMLELWHMTFIDRDGSAPIHV